jgi:hypothetical protein
MGRSLRRGSRRAFYHLDIGGGERGTVGALVLAMRLVSLLLLASTACIEVEALDASNINWIDFNPRLRPDLQPLNGSQVVPIGDPFYTGYVAPRDFGAGGPNGDSLVSWMWPSFPGVERHSALTNLGNPRCMWMTANDRAVLAWEAMARIISPPDKPRMAQGRDMIGACTSTHPFDRTVLKAEDGTEIHSTPESVRFVKNHGGVVVTRHTHRPNRDPSRFDPCDGVPPPVETIVTDVEPPCAPDPETGGVPLCNPTGCSYAVTEDTSFTATATFLERTSPPRQLGPHIKVVGASRKMSRRLQHVGGTSWTWSVPLLQDGRMEENFSVNVNVSGLRVFLLLKDGRAIYKMPRGISLNGAAVCSPDPANPPADFDIYKVCDAAHGSLLASDVLTPAYDVDDPRRRRTEWGFDIGSVAPGDAVYVEFTLRDGSSRIPAIALSPSVVDFGRVQRNTSVTEYLFVENAGTTNIDVDSVTSSSGDIGVRALAPSLPFRLRPREVLAIEAVATARTGGVTGRIDVTAIGGLRASATARFELIDGPLAHAFPAPLGFTYHNPNPNTTGHYRKHVVLANNGHMDMTRRSVRLEASATGTSRPDLWMFEINGAPVATYPGGTIILPPGDYEELVLLFRPPATVAYGDYTADLVFDTDGTNFPSGLVRVPLKGLYMQ